MKSGAAGSAGTGEALAEVAASAAVLAAVTGAGADRTNPPDHLLPGTDRLHGTEPAVAPGRSLLPTPKIGGHSQRAQMYRHPGGTRSLPAGRTGSNLLVIGTAVLSRLINNVRAPQ